MARSASGFLYGLDCSTLGGYYHPLVYYDPGYVLIPCLWGISVLPLHPPLPVFLRDIVCTILSLSIYGTL